MRKFIFIYMILFSASASAFELPDDLSQYGLRVPFYGSAAELRWDKKIISMYLDFYPKKLNSDKNNEWTVKIVCDWSFEGKPDKGTFEDFGVAKVFDEKGDILITTNKKNKIFIDLEDNDVISQNDNCASASLSLKVETELLRSSFPISILPENMPSDSDPVLPSEKDK